MTLHIINYYCFESHDRQEQENEHDIMNFQSWTALVKADIYSNSTRNTIPYSLQRVQRGWLGGSVG